MLKTGTLFGLGHYSRLGHYSNNYSTVVCVCDDAGCASYLKLCMKLKVISEEVGHYSGWEIVQDWDIIQIITVGVKIL